MRQGRDAEAWKEKEAFRRSASLQDHRGGCQHDKSNNVITLLTSREQASVRHFNQPKQRQRRQPVGQVHENSRHYIHSHEN